MMYAAPAWANGPPLTGKARDVMVRVGRLVALQLT